MELLKEAFGLLHAAYDKEAEADSYTGERRPQGHQLFLFSIRVSGLIFKRRRFKQSPARVLTLETSGLISKISNDNEASPMDASPTDVAVKSCLE